MKLLSCLLAASLLLNVYVLYRLDEVSLVSSEQQEALLDTRAPKSVHPAGKSGSSGDLVLLQQQVAGLATRMVSLEEIIEREHKAEEGSPSALSAEHRQTKAAIESLRNVSNAVPGEDWFWTGTGEGELSLNFDRVDGFSVDSVVCRSDWCRVELEDTSGAGSRNLISDLELHLRINESLGRDTVIRSGERHGARRVLFIQ